MSDQLPEIADIFDPPRCRQAYVKFCELRGERPLPETNPHFQAGYLAGIQMAIEHLCIRTVPPETGT